MIFHAHGDQQVCLPDQRRQRSLRATILPNLCQGGARGEGEGGGADKLGALASTSDILDARQLAGDALPLFPIHKE